MKNRTEKPVTHSIGRRVLLLVATVITAIAVSVTCAFCFNAEKPIGSDAVSAGNGVTSAANSQNWVGNIRNGDVKTYSAGTSYAVTLPRGTYKLEAYGAKGGSYSSSSGGKGGYTYGTYTINTTTTIYIYVGSMGANGSSTNSTKAGGYNGGGSAQRYGAGGGGATHFATRDGLLSSLNSYRSNVLIVAGGGGGAQQKAGGAGGGGTRNGSRTPATSYGTGGCGGGTGGPHGDKSSSHSSGSQSGSFGQGGPGLKGGDGNGGGGGGGGYFGGCGTTSDGSVVDDKGGGGGSGYINTSYVSGGGTSGQNAGQGSAKITAINVNTPPTTKNFTVSGSYSRGTSRGIKVYSYNIAQDPDPTNTTGANANSVYFTAGSSSNYQTMPGANAGLFLDSSCTKVANAYLQWTWSGTQTLNINSILKYPRSGVDGQANGVFTLYTRVRDHYPNTSSPTQHGVSVISFKLNVTDNAITTKINDQANNVEISKSGYVYRVGMSTSIDPAYNYLGNTKSIFNNGGTNRRTVFLPKPISPTDKTSYTIYASDIYSDADTSYDKVAFKTVASTTSTAYYTITYNSDSTYASGLYPSITVKATGARPPQATYVRAVITAQSSETAAKSAIGGTNTAVELVFKISNTRPYFASTAAFNTGKNEPLVTVTPGGIPVDLKLDDFLYDIDDGAKISSAFVQGTGGIKIPQKEYVQVDISNYTIDLKSNVNSNYYGKGTVNTTAGQLTSKTGEGNEPTHFAQTLIAPLGSTAAATANVLYSYVDSKTIRFTARAATQNQYRKSDGSVDETRLGHFYVLVRVVDPSDTTDDGIWYPIAIKVESKAPEQPNPLGNITLDFDYTVGTADPDGRDAVSSPKSQFMTPIGYTDDNGVLRGVGSNRTDITDTGNAIPFAVDPDGFAYPHSAGSTLTAQSARALNDFVVIDGNDAILDNDVNTTGTFFRVDIVNLSASDNVFSKVPSEKLTGLGISVGNNGIATFKGLEITPLRSTNGEYFQFRVKVKDSHGTTGTVSVCVKVENRAVAPRRAPDSSSAYKLNELNNGGRTPFGDYGHNANIGRYAVNYTIENMDVIQLTPYDFAYDLDVDYENNKLNKDGFNTNPADSGFAAAATFITQKYSVAHTSSPSTPATAKDTATMCQQLTFANPETIESNAAQYSGYITTRVVNKKCVVGTTQYDIPCIEITGNSRTTSAIVQLRFSVTDGFTSVECLITVTVKNSAPLLNTKENHKLGPNETEDRDRIVEPYELTATVDTNYNRITPNYMEFTAARIAYDKDGDTPTFYAGSAKIVAKDGDLYYESLYYDSDKNTFRGYTEDVTLDVGDVVYDLSDYATAVITKNSDGYDVVRIGALSSTELFDKPIYLQFDVQDGFRADPGVSTLHMLISVKNSVPTFVTENLNKTKEDKADPANDEWSWLIGYENDRTELNSKRYITNSKELCESSVINVPSSDKIWLFDDSDAEQRVLVNPASWSGVTHANDLVVKYNSRVSAENPRPVDEGIFAANANASIIYTPMYADGSVADNFVNVTMEFYAKTERNGVTEFTPVELNNIDQIKQSIYWAIVIEDKHTTGNTYAMQLAISVKDDHHGVNLFTDAYKTEREEDANDSQLKVFNFFYAYKDPGVMAMHTYYRTNGNTEANMLVQGSADTYLVDQKGINPSYHLVDENAFNDKTNAEKQAVLKTTEFNPDFQYRYFVKTVASTPVKQTYKHFQNVAEAQAFHYKPIEVGNDSTGNAVNVPMSYIAMPIAHDPNTENSRHVTFANATAANALDGDNRLLDKEYLSWAPDSVDVLANVTLSDGTNSWTGKAELEKNPYINIRYVTKDSATFYNNYINKIRFTVTESDGTPPLENTDFREDKYGFSFSRKTNCERAPGLLKLTFKLKTVGKDADTRETAIENVDVNIKLFNSYPTIKYLSSNDPGQVTDVKVNMTMGDVNGKSISLVRVANASMPGTKADEIIYSDNDIHDTMKFYMPSAFGTMSEQDKQYIAKASTSNVGKSLSALYTYYNVPNADGLEGVDTETYNPNEGFEDFFDVSPKSGASSVLQFIPKAKTQPNLTGTALDDYLTEHHLIKETGTNKIYYPFRVLFYDDFNGSPFTEGYWATAIIKVYIDNDPVKVNTDIIKYGDEDTKFEYTYKSTNAATAAYNGLPMYTLSLSKNTSFYVDVTSLLIDNDIVLNNGSFCTADDDVWLNLPEDEKSIKDYFVMPNITAPGEDEYVNLYKLVYTNPNVKMPITVTQGNGGNTSKTTLIFNAENAFNRDVDLMFKFSDSNGTSVKVVFRVKYNNASPTPNTDTYGGADTIDITMKTGDSFVLYAADSKLFEKDKDGGFSSYTALKDVKFPYTASGASGSEIVTAAQMRDSFKFFTISYNEPDLTGTSLVIGSDDAASTLRISNHSLASSGDRDYIKVEPFGPEFAREDNSIPAVMAVKVTAAGARTTTLTVTLVDGKGKNTTAKIRINVLSTPPTAKTSGLPSGLTVVKDENDAVIPNTFKTSISFSDTQPAKFALSGFMSDIDFDDKNSLSVYENMDGTMFAVDSPSGTSVLSAESITDPNGITKYVQFRAEDFIGRAGQVATVRFRVVDRNGAVSDTISIEVTIDPASVRPAVQQGQSKPVELMSFAEFSDYNGNANMPQTVQIVQSGNNGLFVDPDVDAPSALYDVSVYALLKKDGEGFTTVSFDDPAFTADKENALLYRISGSSVEEGRGTVKPYVNKFFTLTVSDDGKSFVFIPNSTTAIVNPIMLYVELAKHYLNADATETTMPMQTAVMSVSVKNSKLSAVENSPYNAGYPLVGTGENAKPRESDFLEFRGTAGDSLTWKLYNTDNYELGLFYDWDMRNNDAGKETITYKGFEAKSTVNEGNIKGKGDILSVTTKGTDDGFEITITINRKVFAGTPGADGFPTSASKVDVHIYAADAANKSATMSDKDRLTDTVISVYVENDVPEIAQTGIVQVCPYCGESELISQSSANEAVCNTCKRRFKSLDPDRLGYTLTFSDVDGYVLEADLELNQSLTLNIADIIDDADIAMDQYVLRYAGDTESLMDSSGNIASGITYQDRQIFAVTTNDGTNEYAVTTLKQIKFTCRSSVRGTVATCKLKFRDSVKDAETQVLTVHLTVDNIAPTLKPDVSTDITVLGVGPNGKEEDVQARTKTFDLLKFITDANGDDFDPTDPANEGKRPTYVYIDQITMFMSDDYDNAPELYGPNLIEINESGEEYYTVDTACTVNWADAKHQKFSIQPFIGIYGVQKIALLIVDSGFEDGADADIVDGKTYTLMLTITVANPLDDVPETLETKNMVYGVTRTVTAADLLGEENAKGYTIDSMEEINTNYLRIYAPGSGAETSAAGDANSDWRIYAWTEDVSASVKVVFRADQTTVERTLPVKVVVNNAPIYKNGIKSYIYTTKQLDDRQNRTKKIYPEDWFEDLDAEDIMTFITPVTSSQSVKVEAVRAIDSAEEGGRAYILLKFNRRGDADITVNISDLSGRSYSRTIKVNCTDAPEMSWWEDFVSLVEANWMWFWIIVAGSVVFIALLIILIVVIHKKRKVRREIEALLESETELEEEMLRLSGGAAQYQSFGYLPPVQQAMIDPGLMLGGGATAPASNSLQLNAGTGAPSTGTQPPPQIPQNTGASFNTIPGSEPQRTAQPQQQPTQGYAPQQGQQGAPQQGMQRPQPGMTQNQQARPQPGQPVRPQTPPQQGVPRTISPNPPTNSDGFDPNDF